MQDEGLEVFQDLRLRGPERQRSVLHQALLNHAVAPWRHAIEKENQMTPIQPGENVLVFERAGDEEVDAASLFLLSRSDGYAVTNIVPLQVGQLSYHRYNAVLQDFIHRLARPASQEAGFVVEETANRQSITDWLSPDTAKALRSFSKLANKSTGSSHPFDQKRWFAFIIKAHEEKQAMDSSKLVRWLVEVEGWPDEQAVDLAIQFEFALDLLIEYDQCRP